MKGLGFRVHEYIQLQPVGSDHTLEEFSLSKVARAGLKLLITCKETPSTGTRPRGQIIITCDNSAIISMRSIVIWFAYKTHESFEVHLPRPCVSLTCTEPLETVCNSKLCFSVDQLELNLRKSFNLPRSWCSQVQGIKVHGYQYEGGRKEMLRG